MKLAESMYVYMKKLAFYPKMLSFIINSFFEMLKMIFDNNLTASSASLPTLIQINYFKIFHP